MCPTNGAARIRMVEIKGHRFEIDIIYRDDLWQYARCSGFRRLFDSLASASLSVSQRLKFCTAAQKRKSKQRCPKNDCFHSKGLH
jgi:hypothetical protein